MKSLTTGVQEELRRRATVSRKRIERDSEQEEWRAKKSDGE